MLGGRRGSRIWVLIAAVNEFTRALLPMLDVASGLRVVFNQSVGREWWTGDVGLFSVLSESSATGLSCPFHCEL